MWLSVVAVVFYVSHKAIGGKGGKSNVTELRKGWRDLRSEIPPGLNGSILLIVHTMRLNEVDKMYSHVALVMLNFI